MPQYSDHLGRPIVVVTGMGVLTSLGQGQADNWKALTAGTSGIRRISRFPIDGLRTNIAGTVDFVSMPEPSAPAAKPSPAPGDPFGEEVTLTPKTIIYLKGNSTWDKALDNLQDAFKSVYGLLEQRGIAKAGPAMTIYTQADDTGFSYQAAVPIAEEPKDPPKGDIGVGQSPLLAVSLYRATIVKLTVLWHRHPPSSGNKNFRAAA